jgi:hypothetical protein
MARHYCAKGSTTFVNWIATRFESTTASSISTRLVLLELLKVTSVRLQVLIIAFLYVLSTYLIDGIENGHMKCPVFWDTALYNHVKVNWRLRGTSLPSSGSISETRNQHEAGSKQSYVPPKCRLTFAELHGVISQKIKALNNHRCENLSSDRDTLLMWGRKTAIVSSPSSFLTSVYIYILPYLSIFYSFLAYVPYTSLSFNPPSFTSLSPFLPFISSWPMKSV